MDKYLVISHHTTEDCGKAVEDFIAHYHAGFLTHFDWGCYDNDHNAYALIEAESHEHATMSVPTYFRGKAKAIKVVHFKPETSMDDTHKKD